MLAKFIGGYAYFEKQNFLANYIAPQIPKLKTAVRKILSEKFTEQERLVLNEGRTINMEPETLVTLTDSLSREALLRQEKQYVELVEKLDACFAKTSMGKFFKVLRQTSKLFDRQFRLLDIEIRRRALEQGLPGILVPLSDKYLELYRILSGG